MNLSENFLFNKTSKANILPNKQLYLSIGTMSGTSMDGIDAAIVETDGYNYVHSIAGDSIKFTPAFQLALRIGEFAVAQEQGNLKLAHKNFCYYLNQYFDTVTIDPSIKKNLNTEFGQDFSDLSLEIIIQKFTYFHEILSKRLLDNNKLTANNISVIGFHGQTFYHNPSQALSVQIGDGQKLANSVNIPVINNFRDNDVKNGGQGAPFAPLYHQVLARQKNIYPLVIVNCGGIANITVITGKSPQEIIGFDTGPGNVLLDRFIRLKTKNKEMLDLDGRYGSLGQVRPELLSLLNKEALKNYGEDFFNKLPPKSLDSSHCQLIKEIMDLSINDGAANLAAFTVKTIVDSIDLIPNVHSSIWVLAGGGWQNPIILNFFKGYLYEKLGKGVKIWSAEEFGLSSKYMEAEIFAYLAVRSLLKLPISFPNITGVRVPMHGGDKYMPNNVF